MKLEPKHILKHLPYDVQVLDLITNKAFALDVDNLSQTLNDIEHLNSVKLALHPLSDLTKPITHKGETFVPMDMINNNTNDSYSFCVEFIINGYGKDKILFSHKYDYDFTFEEFDEVMNKLLEWHFDIDNLIGHGLAVDINTLK